MVNTILGLYLGFLAMRSENKYIFKAEWRGLKMWILAACDIVTEKWLLYVFWSNIWKKKYRHVSYHTIG